MTIAEAPALACSVCHADGRLAPYLAVGQRQLWRCGDCRLIVPEISPSVDRQRQYYTTAYYAGKPAYFPLASVSGDHSRLQLFARVMAELSLLVPAGVLFDGGCGLGTFVALARRRGWRATGVDLSPDAARLARAQTTGGLCVGALGALPCLDDSVDVMTLLDVLGDCADPRGVVCEARRVLRPGGLLAVTTVDVDSAVYQAAQWSYRITGGRCTTAIEHGFAEDQSVFFSLPTLAHFLEREGFRVVRAHRSEGATEHMCALAQPWLRWPLQVVLAWGRLIGRPLECCVYAVKT